ncbi:MAG: beta-lactamase family protein [Acidobacteria bacterium]|nr:beta-lactamase family protein [Acidobacteriota bacterium]
MPDLHRNHPAFPLLLAAVLSVSSFSIRPVADPRGTPSPLSRIDGVVRQAIDNGRIPGAVVLVGQGGHILFEKAYGHRCLEPRPEPMTLETRFDLASLTKVLATATGVLILVQDGKARLEDPVSRYLPDFGRRGKGTITIRQVLTHYSGLAPYFRLEAKGPEAASAVIDKICHSDLSAAPGSDFIYSDLGFILLGRLIEVVSGEPLDRFVRSRVFSPLKMVETGFRPPPGGRHPIAPTEKGVDGSFLRGQVHDPLAMSMGGVAGHAGLFSNARDLSRYCRMVLNDGWLEGASVLQPRMVRQMVAPQSSPGKPDIRGLGWDIQSRYSSPKGTRFSARSFGHTGFTGTSLWLDPEIQAYLIILTSRLHPDGKGDVRALRKEIATIVGEALSPTKSRAGGAPAAASRTRRNINR